MTIDELNTKIKNLEEIELHLLRTETAYARHYQISPPASFGQFRCMIQTDLDSYYAQRTRRQREASNEQP